MPYCVYMSLSYLRITEVFKCNFTNTRIYNFDALKPHFYIVNLVFTGLYNIILISAQKRRFWILVRTATPRRFK